MQYFLGGLLSPTNVYYINSAIRDNLHIIRLRFFSFDSVNISQSSRGHYNRINLFYFVDIGEFVERFV